MINITCQLNLSALEHVERTLEGELAKAVQITTLKGEEIMKGWIRAVNAIDTGAMLNSVYSITYRTNNYSAAVAAASALYVAKKKRGWPASPPIVSVGVPIDKWHGYIGVGAEYGPYVNYGSPARGIPGAFFVERTAMYLNPFFQQQVRMAILRSGRRG